MADIKQAAKWMQEGKRVRRPQLHPPISMGIVANGVPRIYVRGVVRPTSVQDSAPFDVEDFLAEDWEIAV